MTLQMRVFISSDFKLHNYFLAKSLVSSQTIDILESDEPKQFNKYSAVLLKLSFIHQLKKHSTSPIQMVSAAPLARGDCTDMAGVRGKPVKYLVLLRVF